MSTTDSTTAEQQPIVREVHFSHLYGMAGDSVPTEGHGTYVFVGDRVYLRTATLCILPQFGPAGWAPAPNDPKWQADVDALLADVERYASETDGRCARVWWQDLEPTDIPQWPWPAEVPTDADWTD